MTVVYLIRRMSSQVMHHFHSGQQGNCSNQIQRHSDAHKRCASFAQDFPGGSRSDLCDLNILSAIQTQLKGTYRGPFTLNDQIGLISEWFTGHQRAITGDEHAAAGRESSRPRGRDPQESSGDVSFDR